jgi:hypothetical protein
MRGFVLRRTDTSKITPAVLRLFLRSVVIEGEVDDFITDAEHLTLEELKARTNRTRVLVDRMRHDADFDLEAFEAEEREAEAEEQKAKATILARHREYQYIKSELGRLLELGPDDIHPLDVKFDQEWEAGDPRIEAWLRAHDLLQTPV